MIRSRNLTPKQLTALWAHRAQRATILQREGVWYIARPAPRIIDYPGIRK